MAPASVISIRCDRRKNLDRSTTSVKWRQRKVVDKAGGITIVILLLVVVAPPRWLENDEASMFGCQEGGRSLSCFDVLNTSVV